MNGQGIHTCSSTCSVSHPRVNTSDLNGIVRRIPTRQLIERQPEALDDMTQHELPLTGAEQACTLDSPSRGPG